MADAPEEDPLAAEIQKRLEADARLLQQHINQKFDEIRSAGRNKASTKKDYAVLRW